MDIQYERTMKHSYMVLRLDESEQISEDAIKHELLVQKMWEVNQIQGILKWSSVEKDGQMHLLYEISGYHNLAEALKTHMTDSLFYTNFAKALKETYHELLRYYMNENHLLLQPEYIYMNAERQQFLFTYNSYQETDLREQLVSLFAQLLSVTDTKDSGAVTYVYQTYEQLFQGDLPVWDCLKEKTMTKEKVEIHKNDRIATTNQDEELKTTENNVYKKLLEWMPKRGIEKWKQEIKGHRSVESIEAEGVYYFEPSDEDEALDEQHKTTYLGAEQPPDRAGIIEGVLLYIGRKREDDIRIPDLALDETFVIGSGFDIRKEGRIKSFSVSRRHAFIRRTESGFELMDLNSKNGTFLNEELLSYQSWHVLKKGDHIRFASEEYEFI